MKNVLAETRPGSRPVHLPGLIAFESVARHLSFARAAAELEVTPTAISKTVKQLESQLGTRLLNRTTRSVAVTEAGAKLLASLGPALQQIRSSVQQAGESANRPFGTLRINTSYVAYASLIEPHLEKFMQRYPEIALDVAVDNNLSDIVSGGFDAGIRLGHALQKDVVAVPMGPMQQLVVVASPEYFKRTGIPKTPQDLLTHNCIRQRINRSRFLEWEFRSGTKSLRLDVRGRLVFDEMRSALYAAVRGCGVAYVFRHFAARELASDELVAALEKYCPQRESFYLYYANRAQMPAKLRAFIEFVQAVNWKVPA